MTIEIKIATTAWVLGWSRKGGVGNHQHARQQDHRNHYGQNGRHQGIDVPGDLAGPRKVFEGAAAT